MHPRSQRQPLTEARTPGMLTRMRGGTAAPGGNAGAAAVMLSGARCGQRSTGRSTSGSISRRPARRPRTPDIAASPGAPRKGCERAARPRARALHRRQSSCMARSVAMSTRFSAAASPAAAWPAPAAAAASARASSALPAPGRPRLIRHPARPVCGRGLCSDGRDRAEIKTRASATRGSPAATLAPVPKPAPQWFKLEAGAAHVMRTATRTPCRAAPSSAAAGDGARRVLGA